MQTTLNKIKSYQPCGIQNPEDIQEGWGKLLHHLGKTEANDDALDLRTISESNGVLDTIWAMRAVDDSETQILGFVLDCFEIGSPSFQHFFGLENTNAAFTSLDNFLVDNSETNREQLIAAFRKMDSSRAFDYLLELETERQKINLVRWAGSSAYFFSRIAINCLTKSSVRRGENDFNKARLEAISVIEPILNKYI